jgi:multidrug transporter EmrE-like cation transporter
MPERSQTMPIILNLIAAFFGAIGQYLYKQGGKRLGTEPIYQNWPLFVGMVLFCGIMVLFVWAFKMGGRLSVVYPVYATTFIWGTLLAIWGEKEAVSAMQMVGIGIVFVGVSLIAVGYPR